MAVPEPAPAPRPPDARPPDAQPPEARPPGERRWWIAGLVLLIGAASVAVTTLQDRGQEEGTLVRAGRVTRGAIVSRVRAQGRVRARRQARVGSELSGRVVAVFVEEGDTVAVADPLFSLDDEQHRNAVAQLSVARRSAQALVDKAELMLTEAERGLARDRSLRQRQVIPADQVAASEARVKLASSDVASAKASLERTGLDLARARDALRKTRVLAPIAGTVVSVGLEVGMVVAPLGGGLPAGGMGLDVGGGLPGGTSAGQEIVIADLTELMAELEVDELDIARVQVGQRVELRVQGDARVPLSGRVERAGLFGRDSGGAVIFPVVASIGDSGADGGAPPLVTEGPPARDRLRPGMTVAADIEVQILEDTVVVPLAAVLEAKPGDEGADRVYVIVDEGPRQVARVRPISVGPSERDRVSVLGGLQLGEVLIEGPYRALRELNEGDPVRIDGELDDVAQTGLSASAQP